jgi:hypothetical protein
MTGYATANSVHPSRPAYRLLAAQLLLAVAALALLLLWPQGDAPMLLLPVFAADQGTAVRYAMTRDARLLSSGPVPGSIVVRGDRDRIVAGAWSAGLLVTAARGGCGEGRS